MSYTRQQWATDLLRALGNPSPDQNTVNWVIGWTDYETAPGQSASYNLLNTTLGAPGASNYNSVGVKNYSSYQQGIQANAATLEGGYYPSLLADLRSNNIADLINNPAVTQQIATWGTHKSGAQIWTIAGQGASDTYGGNMAGPPNQQQQQQLGILGGILGSQGITSMNPQQLQAFQQGLVAGAVTGAAGTTSPWYCFFMPSGTQGCPTTPLGNVNWSDIAIRAGLIILGMILVIVVIAKMLQHPTVQVVEE